MKYIKSISRKSDLLPIYTLWKGSQKNIDEFIAESKRGFISYNAEFNCRRKASQQLTEKILSNPYYVQEYFEEVMNLAEKTRKESKRIKEVKTRHLLNQELWDNIKTVLRLLYGLGETITQAREHAFDYVIGQLTQEYPEEFVNNLLMNLTTTTRKSLAVIEEEELLKKAVDLGEVHNSVKFSEFVNSHHDSWSWIPTDWMVGMPWTKKDIQNRLVKAVTENPEKRLQNINTDFLKKEKDKEELFFKHIESIEVRHLIEMMEIEAFYRLHRRYVISELLHFSRNLFEELASRMKLERNLVYNLLPHEIENFLLDGVQPEVVLVKERLVYFVLHGKNNKIKIYYGIDAEKIAQILYSEVDETLNVLKGSVACQGKVIGIARVIHSKEDFHKIDHNEILVTHETTPNFVPILHKVGAIVTDEGGISCHAAVISREMNIPCIVGTSHGTKIIKDGDRIKVDAFDGIVTKLE